MSLSTKSKFSHQFGNSDLRRAFLEVVDAAEKQAFTSRHQVRVGAGSPTALEICDHFRLCPDILPGDAARLIAEMLESCNGRQRRIVTFAQGARALRVIFRAS